MIINDHCQASWVWMMVFVSDGPVMGWYIVKTCQYRVDMCLMVLKHRPWVWPTIAYNSWGCRYISRQTPKHQSFQQLDSFLPGKPYISWLRPWTTMISAASPLVAGCVWEMRWSQYQVAWMKTWNDWDQLACASIKLHFCRVALRRGISLNPSHQIIFSKKSGSGLKSGEMFHMWFEKVEGFFDWNMFLFDCIWLYRFSRLIAFIKVSHHFLIIVDTQISSNFPKPMEPVIQFP